MTRKECLDAAAGCVLKDRNASYGGPEDSFGLISTLWSAYLGTAVDKVDVAMMMGMLKMARIRSNKGYADGFVDLAGYAACAAECAASLQLRDESGPKFEEGEAVQYTYQDPSDPKAVWADAWYVHPFTKKGEHVLSHGAMNNFVHPERQIRRAPKPTEAEPQFRHGDKIQYRVTLPSVSDRIWVDGTYDHLLPHGAGHMVRGGFKGDLVVVGNDDIRLVAIGGSEAKVEGCEELVQKDLDRLEKDDAEPAIYGAHLE